MDLTYFARKYIWWQTPESAITSPHRIIAQVMNLGTFEDAQAALEHFGADAFKNALASAPAGALNPRSWNFWHLYLGLANGPGEVPPMPVRKMEDA